VSLPETTPEILEAREFLRSRILQQAKHEGHPLSQLEIDYLDSDHLPNEREIMERFEAEYEFQGFLEHIGGLLRRAREMESAADPEARKKYQEMATRLSGSLDDFILFSAAVMGLSEPKRFLLWPWVAAILFLAAIAAYYSAKLENLIP